ncbi:alsin-like isoform X5 [Cynoglossus semilaevis]|uniref:alsin-like isoform X5 n=1 Tax=Cynoglossus semilaevis TaxID=244447 RepID=UPI000D626BF1|nr:alsin-like isoform X5 [Cynoglossus semilaevis]
MMQNTNENESPETSAHPERGLVHIWQSVGSGGQQLCPEKVLLPIPVLQVSLGEHHGLLLTLGGHVYSFGELLWRDVSVPVSAPLLEKTLVGKTMVRVAAGGFHCGALCEQGYVYMWGENTAGQCGLSEQGSVTNVTVPEPCLVSVVDNEVVPPAVVRVVNLACGREHSLALSTQNEVWAWGSGCQLGLVTNSFPVWKPQKVEHLAGRHVIQVACGAYHSLALVRTLPTQNNNTQNTSEKEGAPPPQYSLTETEELCTIDDAHYCPLGVELTESLTSESSSQRRSPRHKLHLGRRSAGSSPGSGSGSCPLLDVKAVSQRKDLLESTSCESDGNNDSLSQPDSRLKSESGSCWKVNKRSALCDEMELHNLLQKLSGHSLELHENSVPGDTDSLSSHTSDDSCVSSTVSSYRDDSSVKSQTTNAGAVPGCYSSSPVCLEEVRVCLEAEKATVRGQKSSSQSGTKAGNRRRSLPGTPNHGSPRRRRSCARRPSSSGRTATPEETRDELPSLETEVWSWGRGSEGQLGHGDQLARLQPLCVKSLTGKEVTRVAAGSHHSLALTAQCKVFSWGSNMCGQLGHVNSPVTVPQEVKLSEGLQVWDVSAGQSHSLLLADGDSVQPVLLYCGQHQQPTPVHNKKPHQSQRSSQRSPRRAESYTVRPIQLPVYMEMSYFSTVCCGGQNCAVLADQNVMGFISTIHELASRERRFYCWLSDIRSLLLTPTRNKETSCSSLGELWTHLFISLCETFNRLSILIGRHSTLLSYFLHDVQSHDITSLLHLTHIDEFLEVYKEYCSALGNFQVMNGFQLLHKLSLEVLGSKQTTLARLCVPDQSATGDVDLVTLLYWPLQQPRQYNRLLLKLAACYDVLTTEYESLHQASVQYESLSLFLMKKKKEAETTFLFWKSHSGKYTEELRLPQRRVVCESSNRSLTLQNARRFSNHWFILFNDALVHTQFSTHHISPLTCLWVKPVTDDSSGLHAIKITCPEESFTIVASSPQEKNKWLRALNQAVDQVLGGGAQGSSPGMMGVSRTASYTFSGEGRFKEARYIGGWLAGRVHGRGIMKWPNGQTYTGNFKNGLEDGYGEVVIPNKEQNQPDIYQGQWREGRIHGFGKYRCSSAQSLRYASGEVYEGCFCDGQRHGYGMLSSGKQTRTSASVFIGEWVQDRKTGYGVYDDITRVLGFWFVMTILFSTGSFLMTGQSTERFFLYLLIHVLDTYLNINSFVIMLNYWSFSLCVSLFMFLCSHTSSTLQGVLSLVNGDCLDGLFSGEWNTGLKVVATYSKPAVDEPDNKDRNRLFRTGQYLSDTGHRWGSVFSECWRRLGCDANGRGERTTAWENIAVTITNARRRSINLSRSQSKVLECLELIPHHAEAVTTANYNNIRRYLIKACETPIHPLGWLVETLVTVYRMTYVGVGSNRRLLRQAVQEVQAYLSHYFNIVRFLFPGLPEDGGVLPDPPASLSKSRHNSNTEEQGFLSSCLLSSSVVVVSCSSLLLPLLLPRLYPPLFTLYCLQEEQKEYWECVLQLNRQPDQSLLSFLGVQKKFWPVLISVFGETKQIVSSSEDACYVSAVETLQQISTTFTPSDKLMVIQKTFEELTQEVKPLVADDFLWSMDDLLPLFLYVVLRARIRNLGAEISLIEDLMDSNVQHGEMGLMFTTLKACYIQILQESSS